MCGSPDQVYWTSWYLEVSITREQKRRRGLETGEEGEFKKFEKRETGTGKCQERLDRGKKWKSEI